MIALWAIASAVTGFGFSLYSVNNGLAVPISGATLSISIFIIAVILLVAVVPIWKYKRNLIKVATTSQAKLLPVNPFYAVRVLLFSKAAAITSAIFLGWHAGVLVKQFTAPVVVTEATTLNFTAAIASIFLLVVAFIVEQICKLPNDKKTDV
jgi:uncharacterized membrane protein YidH (DUF202 family)